MQPSAIGKTLSDSLKDLKDFIILRLENCPEVEDHTAVFNPDLNNTSNLSKWTVKYEKGEDITYYEDDLRPGFMINQEFRIYSNLPRAAQFGMIINF